MRADNDGGQGAPNAPIRASATLVLGVFMAASAFGIDITLPTLPAIADALDVSDRAAQLAVTAALAGFTLGQIPLGLASDRVGRRRMAALSLALFAIGGAGSAASSSIEMLWAFRFVQGLGVAGCPVLARAIVRDLSSGDQAGRRMSTMSAILGVISFSAPILGGALLALGGWRLPYVAIALYGVATLIAMSTMIPESSAARRALGSPLRQLTQSASTYFRSPTTVAASVLYALVFSGFGAFLTNGSTIATRVYGVPAAWFGLLFAAVVGPQVAGALLSRRLSLRWGMSRVLGTGVSAIALASAALFVVGWLSDPAIYTVWAAMMVYGLGFGILMPSSAAMALEPVPDIAGFASALMGTLQVGFGTLSSAIAAALYQGNPRSMCWVMAGSGLAVVLISRIWRKSL